MPELPEVEAARLIIAEHCVGRIITDVQAEEDQKVFDGASAETVVSALKGRRVLAAGRKGKQMWLRLDGAGLMPLMHFGMTGFIAVRDEPDKMIHVVAYENAPKDTTANWPPRFLKLLVHFGPHPNNPRSQACQLAYCDARRFGRIKLVTGDPAESDTVDKLGFDPLLQMPDLEGFTNLLTKKSKGAARLKPLLLDQSFCAGVGNWVADEVLWQARLHPEQLIAALQPQHIQQLHTSLQHVVQTAVAAKADSSQFPGDWMFHVRWGRRAGSLLGHKLNHITVGSRTSCYVPALQKVIGGEGGAGGKAVPAKRQAAGKAKRKPAATKRRKNRSDSTESDEEASDSDNDSSGQGKQQEQAPGAVSPSERNQVAVGSKGQVNPNRRVKKAAAPAVSTAQQEPEEPRDSTQAGSSRRRGGQRT